MGFLYYLTPDGQRFLGPAWCTTTDAIIQERHRTLPSEGIDDSQGQSEDQDIGLH